MTAPAAAAVSKLVSLFGLSFIAHEAGDFLEDGYLSGQQVRAMHLTMHGIKLPSLAFRCVMCTCLVQSQKQKH